MMLWQEIETWLRIRELHRQYYGNTNEELRILAVICRKATAAIQGFTDAWLASERLEFDGIVAGWESVDG